MKHINWKTVGKQVLLYTLGTLGFSLFLLLAGEEDPANPMSFSKFLLIKVGAMAGLYICYLIGKYLYHAGLLPDSVYEGLEDEEV